MIIIFKLSDAFSPRENRQVGVTCSISVVFLQNLLALPRLGPVNICYLHRQDSGT